MKLCLKILSAILAITVFLTVFQIPFSVFADDLSQTFEENPLIVKPFTEWESFGAASKSRQEVVTPLGWTDTKGLMLSATAQYTNDYPASSNAYARYKTDGNFVLGDTTHIIMYVKTDSANTVLPTICYNGAFINTGYDPSMSVGVGKPYSYLPINSDKWISAKTVEAWKAASGDTDGDGVSDTYFGGMRFEQAFEGYIKFAIADLSNDNARINRLDRATTRISMFNLSVARIGGEYGTVTAGPIFLTDSDSDSADLLTPEIEAVGFEGFTVKRSGGYGNSVYPIEGSSLSGESLNRNLEWDVPQTKFTETSSCYLQFTDIGMTMKDTEGYMFYLSVPEKTTTTFVMVLEDPKDTSRWKFSYLPSLMPLAGEDYYFLSEGDNVWHSGELVYTNESGSKYRGGIYFEEGFSGYVKIPYSSLGNDSGFKFNPQLDTLGSLAFYFDRFGGKYGQVIAGPNFLVLNDGINGEIALKEDTLNSALELDNYSVDKGIEIGEISTDVIVNKELKLKGISVDNTSLLEYTSNAEVGAQSDRFVSLNYNNEELTDTSGLLLYIKLPAENLVTLSAVLECPEDTSRWSLSEAPTLSLYEGESCYVLPLDENEWQEKTVVKASGNAYNGGVEFASDFEGFIKIPYSALRSDQNSSFSVREDILNSLTLRFKRVGGSYGSLSVSNAYLLEKSSSCAEILLISKGKINVAECQNGTVSVGNASEYSGEKVSVTVAPDEGYTLKADGLYIEYCDYLGNKKQIFADYDSNNKAFSFVMPKTASVTVSAEFVSAQQQNFALLEPKVSGENSLEFTFREYQNAYSASKKGVLIALEASLGGKELSADLNAVDVIDVVFSEADSTFELQENKVYSDFKVRIDDIKTENLKRNYVVRGYSVIDGEYSYTQPVTVNYNDTKGMLGQYESFSEAYKNGSYSKIYCSYVDTPCGELNFTQGIKAQALTTAETSLEYVRDSAYWFSTGFNPIEISEFYYIGIYIKAPTAKDNILYLNFTDTNGQAYKIMSGKEYILIDKSASNTERRTVLEGGDKYYGVLTIPAGFEGLVCIPISSLYPQSPIKPNTKLVTATYRFGYLGKGENAVTVGPMVGFKQNTRVINDKELLSDLPAGSADFAINHSLTEAKDDTAIFYWDSYPDAENYLIKAYKRVIGGYLCVSENTHYSNSGSVGSLAEGEEYLLTLSARDKRDNVLAEYGTSEFVFNPSKNYVDIKQEGIIYDAVDYTAGNVKGSPFVNRTYTTLNAYNSSLLNSNPNRGFRGVIDFFHFNLTEDAVKSEIEKDIKQIKQNGFNSNVYVCYFYPGDYLGKDLTPEFFETAQKIFDYFRENQIQILLRFAYFDVNNFNQRTPTAEEIEKHISQLADNGLIERNKDVLHAFQVGFAGKYGEWHSDIPAFSNDAERKENRQRVLNAFVEKLLPDNVYAQLRMPNFKDFLTAENLTEYGNRFGFHLDSFYGIMDGSESGSGQYSYGYADWDRHIAEACVTPNDAEVYYWSQFDDVGIYPQGYASIIGASQLRLTTFSAVNGYLDQNVNASGCFNEWKKTVVTENWLRYNNLPVTDGWLTDNSSDKVNRNAYEYMRDYLGYRISAKELTVTGTDKGMRASLDLVNYGFSAAFNISSKLVVLDKNNNVICSKEVGNPAEWYGTETGLVPDGELLTHNLTADLEIPDTSGEYKIALQLVSKSGAAARLDNNIPYEDGYNILHSFVVE
ncbi:MAG: DUF4874 domain-containing protein [Clostridia bacterium]|nr:DUF4874 domain-containing protein [Clostridia bacterium]